MKTRHISFLLIPIASLSLTQCVVELDENGNVPGTSVQPAEEVPSTAPVPEKVKADCLAKLQTQIPDRGMRVVRAERGETSFIVDVQVDGVPNLWRCYHDGTSCTGTEYQGEG